MLSRVRLCGTPWTVAHQALLSMGFSRQEYWSGLPFPSPGDLPDRGIKPGSPALQADSLPSEPPGTDMYKYKAPRLVSAQLTSPLSWGCSCFLRVSVPVSAFLESSLSLLLWALALSVPAKRPLLLSLLPPGPRPVSNIWFIIASPCALRKFLIHLQRLCFQVTLHGHILVSVQVVPSPPSLLRIDPEKYLLSSFPPTSVKGFLLAGWPDSGSDSICTGWAVEEACARVWGEGMVPLKVICGKAWRHSKGREQPWPPVRLRGPTGVNATRPGSEAL